MTDAGIAPSALLTGDENASDAQPSGSSLTILTVVAKLGIVIRSKKEDAEISRIAKQWEARGISSPFRLRRWIDKKTKWSAVEVTTRLGVIASSSTRLPDPRSTEENYYARNRQLAIAGH
ncbi:hypothetical protein ACFWN7_08910 [Agromyces sp. NPDC058484]|uniref:hypothetical protein n=1 Tax=Agromyces sp. NPDC058484 TaxID=3346524 RepID=UPI0036546963